MQTPNIDRLAREGMVFERCYVPAPLCVPTRAALMSGQWPTTTGVLGNLHWLDAGRLPEWPQALTAAGFNTAAIGKMHFFPWDARNGFRERISAEDKRHTYLPDDFSKFLQAHGHKRAHPTQNPGYFDTLNASVTPLPKRFHVDGFIGDQAADWLARNSKEPFAAWVSFAGPHDPYDPPEEMADMYYAAPIPEPVGSRAELKQKPRAQQQAGRENITNSMYRMSPAEATPEQHRIWRAHYYANISLIDEEVGKMLAALEANGVLEETLIIYTADHGDALGDHGLPYKGFYYEPMAHVPLIVRGPGVAGGTRCPSLVSSLDYVPLFYSACGMEPPDTLQGNSLAPLLADPTNDHRDIVFSENMGSQMVRDARYKYVHYATGESELYDLESDPDEIRNLAGSSDRSDVISHMRGLLVEHNLQNHAMKSNAVTRSHEPFRVKLEEAYTVDQAFTVADS
jgi:choline-sulfatase